MTGSIGAFRGIVLLCPDPVLVTALFASLETEDRDIRQVTVEFELELESLRDEDIWNGKQVKSSPF